MNWLQWAAFELRYLAARTPWDTGISPPELLHFLDRHPAGRALDIGCGTGTNGLTLAQRGWRVTGLDLSWAAIRRARRRARQAGVAIDFERGDIGRLADLHGPFDLALDIGCFHALAPRQRQRYARHLAGLVVPGGTYLLYGFLAREGRSVPPGIGGDEPARRFGPAFEVAASAQGTDRGWTSAWFTLRRTGA